MAWTEGQQKAIDERNKNLLVAAAAGSGKTAVLVERIKKLVLEENVPIDQMLVVTYTNAAASEMKEKLRRNLVDEIAVNKADSSKLREQLRLMPRASISTFHSFALDVMRRFFYLIDLEPNFSICDDAMAVILKEEAMDELIEKYFEEGSPEFYDFLDCYSSDRNLNEVRDIISKAYEVLRSLPYPWKWLEEKTAELNMNCEEMKNSMSYKFMWQYLDKNLNKAWDYAGEACELLKEEGLDRMAKILEEGDLEGFVEVDAALKTRDFNELREAVCGITRPTLSAKGPEKDDYALIKNRVKLLRDQSKEITRDIISNFFEFSFEEQVEDINKGAPFALTLKKLLYDYNEIFENKKKEKKLIDFSDIEHYSLAILNNQEAADFYKEKFRYIFVDEYQDTNILQEEIINKIKRSNNVFTVGDIKQSIYKFRLAEPEIFKRRYENYKNCTTGESEKIDLNRNFRSKPAILEGINTIFEPLMEGYDEDAKLYPGFNYSGPYNYKPEIYLIDGGTKEDADDEIAEMVNTEVEALEICKLIKENIGKMIYDQKKGIERPLQLNDIVILTRSVKNYGVIFYNIMKENDIDAFINDSESYFDTIEIDVFMKLLSVIDNKMQDIALLSVLHSEIFGFTASELGAVRENYKKMSYGEAFIKYSNQGENQQLKEKCASVIEKISKWKELSLSMPLGKFMWKIMLDSGYYIEMGAMPGGEQRQMNLRALVDKGEKYASERPGSLYNFIKYIDTLKEKKVNVGQVKLVGENDNLVKIMTIHKSKGLEFPMVILSGAGKKLQYTKTGKSIRLHKDIGIGMNVVNYKEHWSKQSLLLRLMKKQIHQEEYEEEIRVLYVALTRAKDLLYITGHVGDGKRFMEQAENGVTGSQSYLSMIGNTYPVNIVNMDQLDYTKKDSENNFNIYSIDNYKNRVSDQVCKKINEKLEYTYQYEEKRKIKSKYSVSEINRGNQEERERTLNLSLPSWCVEKHKITAAEKGTAYHSIMEKLDFAKVKREGTSYIKECVQWMVKQGILLNEESEAVDSSHIENFFNTEIGRRCMEAADKGNLYKERSFNLKTIYEGEEVVVQGIIDCFFEEGGEIVLIDYKTNWIDNTKQEAEEERLRKTYRKQMDIYKEALYESTGKNVKEMYLCHLESGKAIEM